MNILAKAGQAMFMFEDGNPQLLESMTTCDWVPFAHATLLLPGAHGGIIQGPQPHTHFGVQVLDLMPPCAP